MSPSISEGQLRCLYLKECLTDKEIAARHGMTLRQVNYWRKKFGVPTYSKSERLGLPTLTPKQHQLLLGSILGDGRLFSTGSKSAAFSEFHSDAQSEYLSWKANLWGSYLCSIRKAKKETEDGRILTGQVLRTHGCFELRSYWKAAYPSGAGGKTFTRLDLSEIDGFALAVWYLDDGSKTTNGYVRFSVTPDPGSQEVLIRLLRRFGLKPILYGTGGDSTIWVHDKTSVTRFLDLVSEHVPDCMRYKLDLLPRHRGTAVRDRLTETALRQHVAEGRSVKEISNISGASITSVRRIMVKLGVQTA